MGTQFCKRPLEWYLILPKKDAHERVKRSSSNVDLEMEFRQLWLCQSGLLPIDGDWDLIRRAQPKVAKFCSAGFKHWISSGGGLS